jgi:hypothetical protein
MDLDDDDDHWCPPSVQWRQKAAGKKVVVG